MAMFVGQLVGSSLWSKLNHVNKYEMYFSSSANMRLTFVILNENDLTTIR